MYKLIVSDLDETLLNHEKKISDKNLKAIQEARERGVKFVPASGRGYETIQNTVDLLGLRDKEDEYIISFNGGAITENKDNQLLHLKGLERDLANELFRRSKRYGLCTHVYTKDTVYIFGLTEDERAYLDGRMPFIEVDEPSLDFIDDEIIKILYVSTDKDCLKSIEKEMQDLIDQIELSYSANRYIEFNPTGINKGFGLKVLAERLGIDLKDTIAIGDNVNDISMLKEAGIGVGVSNVSDEARAYCDYVTSNDYNHDAVAEVIENLILNVE